MRRFLMLTLVLAGCVKPGPVNTITPVCRIAVPPKIRVDTIRIALPEPVDPARLTLAESDGERLLFAQLYEPLVRRDCAGNVVPGLAQRWEMTADTTWRFQLRSGARFSDGSKVTAAAVAATLSAAVPATWRVSAQGEDLVLVRAPREHLPGVLTEGRFVISKAAGTGHWPLGTLGAISPSVGGVTFRPEFGVIAFTWPAGRDARDLLETGMDGVLTDQPAAVEFAEVRGAFDGRALPWSRTYVLIQPAGKSVVIPPGGGGWPDAVPHEARPATGPFWWNTVQCPRGSPPAPPATAASAAARVVFAQDDHIARGLAERVVARGVSTAAAVAPSALPAALAGGADYVILSLPRSPANPCATLTAAGLANHAPAAFVPLIDTRFQFIARSGRFGVTLDGNGTPRINP